RATRSGMRFRPCWVLRILRLSPQRTRFYWCSPTRMEGLRSGVSAKLRNSCGNLQIRSLANYSILFSWGGVEVKTVAIDEAIASANKRMQLTKPRNTGDAGQQRKSAAHPAAAGGYRQAV